jgi:hypothetical protein
MPENHNFEHLPLLMRRQGKARLSGGSKPSPQTVANRQSAANHSATLQAEATDAVRSYKEHREEREALGRPVLPLLLQIDPSLDLDKLRLFLALRSCRKKMKGSSSSLLKTSI